MLISTSTIRFELIHYDVPVAVTDSADPAAAILAGFLNGCVGMSQDAATEVIQLLERVMLQEGAQHNWDVNEHTLACSRARCMIRTWEPPLADAVAEIETKELKQLIERWSTWIATAKVA